jgi:hypothetical protein
VEVRIPSPTVSFVLPEPASSDLRLAARALIVIATKTNSSQPGSLPVNGSEPAWPLCVRRRSRGIGFPLSRTAVAANACCSS